MRYGQCKCGEHQFANSGQKIFDCQGCEKCGTTLAYGPDGHRPLQPHRWVTRYNENTGKPYKVCGDCYAIDTESFKSAMS